MKKLTLISIILGVFGLFVTVIPASAHVTVKPSQVGVGAFQTFSMGVPNEKDLPTTQVRLLIPNGLKSVTPNVKNGWSITVKKTGEGEEAVVTEIDWSGGLIPAGQRDEFSFSSQVPSSETTLIWKAYQTYEDGEIVEWIHEPSKDHKEDQAPPYSITNVVNDLSAANTSSSDIATTAANSQTNTLLSTVALALSVLAIAMQLRKK